MNPEEDYTTMLSYRNAGVDRPTKHQIASLTLNFPTKYSALSAEPIFFEGTEHHEFSLPRLRPALLLLEPYSQRNGTWHPWALHAAVATNSTALKHLLATARETDVTWLLVWGRMRLQRCKGGPFFERC